MIYTTQLTASANFLDLIDFDLTDRAVTLRAGGLTVTDKGIVGVSTVDPLTGLVLSVGRPIYGGDSVSKTGTAVVPAPTVSVGHSTSLGGGLTTVDINATVESNEFGLPKLTTITSSSLHIPSRGTLDYGVRATVEIVPNPVGVVITGAAATAPLAVRAVFAAARYTFAPYLLVEPQKGR